MNEVNANEVNVVNEVNEVAPEVSTENKVYEEAPEVSAVNEVALEASAVNEVNEVAPEVSAVNKVNEVAPEVKIGMNIKAQVEIIAEALEEQNGAWERGESGVTKFEEVKPDVNAEAKVEMLDVEDVVILANIDKVRLRGNINWRAFYYATALNNVMLFNTEALLIVLFLSRFVNGFREECPIELSDYG